VCDKIIHADTVTRDFKGDFSRPLTVLAGTGPGAATWTMGFSLSNFADCLLWWLNEEHEA